jgi:hypothetical protein
MAEVAIRNIAPIKVDLVLAFIAVTGGVTASFEGGVEVGLVGGFDMGVLLDLQKAVGHCRE